jgi:hypothetical protein
MFLLGLPIAHPSIFMIYHTRLFPSLDQNPNGSQSSSKLQPRDTHTGCHPSRGRSRVTPTADGTKVPYRARGNLLPAQSRTPTLWSSLPSPRHGPTHRQRRSQPCRPPPPLGQLSAPNLPRRSCRFRQSQSQPTLFSLLKFINYPSHQSSKSN